MSALLVFVVPGRPVSWARANIVNGRPTTDKKQRAAKRTYQLAARQALGRNSWDRSGAYSVQVDAYYPNNVTGDIDRIPGLILDALEGVAFEKDRQVSELVVTRQVDALRPRVVVKVAAADPGREADEVIHGEALRQ